MEPAERFELRPVRMRFAGDVVGVEPEHERVREGPALTGEVADVSDRYAGLFYNFARNGFLDIFSCFNESRDEPVDFRKKVAVVRKENLVAARDCDNDRGGELGVEAFAAFRADERDVVF